MAGIKISDATLREQLQGTENLPIVDTDLDAGRTTVDNIKDYVLADITEGGNKVDWTDISTEENPDRKAIVLANHDTILGTTTEGNTQNLIMMSKWDKVDVGTAQNEINLNGSAARPTYNDEKEIALMEDISGLVSLEDFDSLKETVDGISSSVTPTKVSELENDLEFQTKTEVEAAIPTKTSELENDSNFVTTEEISSAVGEGLEAATEALKIYNLGNFASLDALSQLLGYHEYYNNVNRVIYHFTINNEDTGLIINNMGDMVDGLPYTTRQYMYYQEHRYTRTVSRQSDGNVYYTNWIVEDNVTLANKGVIAYDLFNLTEDAADADIQAALTYPNGDGVITEDDLTACIEKGMFLRDYGTNAQLIVGRTITNSQYTITYVGYPMTASSVDTSKTPAVTSVVFTITDGVYKIVKAANTAEVLTTDWEKYPVEILIPIWSLSDRVYSESTILGWFNSESVSELKDKVKNSALVSMLYLNSGNMYYRIPVLFIELTNSDNQIHLATVGVDMSDDSPCRYEITINIDGTVISGESNVSLVKETLVKASELEELKTTLEELVATLADRVTALEQQTNVQYNN